MKPDRSVTEFRKDLKRLASRFLAGKLGESAYLAAVRRSAIERGLMTPQKATRADKVLDLLANGAGWIAPGTLPKHLEPTFNAHDGGQLSAAEVGARVEQALGQVKKTGSS